MGKVRISKKKLKKLLGLLQKRKRELKEEQCGEDAYFGSGFTLMKKHTGGYQGHNHG